MDGLSNKQEAVQAVLSALLDSKQVQPCMTLSSA